MWLTWCGSAKTGKPESKVPKKLMMTDLRVLITRMMSIPNDWKKIKIVPTTSSIEWLQVGCIHPHLSRISAASEPHSR